jgi:1,4-alpha-glucan branching enzyme
MPKKTYSKTGRACRVTFLLPGDVAVQTVALCGEFNNWDPTAHPMRQRKDGSFAVTLSLPAGRPYRYRYLLDGTRWANDPTADGSVPNPFGAEDSLVNV